MDHIRLPFTFEMSTAEDIGQVCLEVHPEEATLVPEKREELTTEGGLDLEASAHRVEAVTARLRDAGIAVSLFVDPDPEIMSRARALGASHVELHTGRYADAPDEAGQGLELEQLQQAASRAQELGLVVNAGHGLTHLNVGPVASIPGVLDLNIGHAIVSRAVFLGLPGALDEMRRAMGS